MTGRITNALIGCGDAATMIRILADALNEACRELRAVNAPSCTAVVKEFERRGLVDVPNVKTKPLTKMDQMIAWLSASKPSGEYQQYFWDLYATARMDLVEIIAADADKAEQAITRPALRGWFVGQLVNKNPPNVDYMTCLSLVHACFDAVSK